MPDIIQFYYLDNNGNLEKVDAGGIGLGMLDFGLPYAWPKYKLRKRR